MARFAAEGKHRGFPRKTGALPIAHLQMRFSLVRDGFRLHFQPRSVPPGGRSMATKKKGKKKAAKKGKKRAAKKPAKKKSKRKPSAAFMKPLTPSAQLAVVVGASPMPRTEVTKRLWGYIKKKGLQDSKNRRMINADDALRPVFGGKGQVSMFDMTKLVAKHLK
jgi:chromatin remodeling complex protein RSC6